MKSYKTVVFMTDQHIPYMDDQVTKIALQYIKEKKPELIVYGGDMFDNPACSDWPTKPEDTRELQEEIDLAVKYMGQVHKAAPKAKKVFLYGNHDQGRLERTKIAKPFALKNLRVLSLSYLIRESAKQQNIEIGRVEFCHEYYLGDLALFVHGDPRMHTWIKGGVTGYRRTAELAPFQGHIVMGHRHRKGEGRDMWKERSVYGVAAMLDPAQVEKVYTGHSTYERGFFIAHYNLKTKEFHAQNLLMNNNRMVIEGKIYK